MTQISEKTALPLKIVVPICVTIMGAAFWIGVEVHSIRVLMQNAWTITDMDRWSAESQILNPASKFPDAYQIVNRRKSANHPN